MTFEGWRITPILVYVRILGMRLPSRCHTRMYIFVHTHILSFLLRDKFAQFVFFASRSCFTCFISVASGSSFVLRTRPGIVASQLALWIGLATQSSSLTVARLIVGKGNPQIKSSIIILLICWSTTRDTSSRLEVPIETSTELITTHILWIDRYFIVIIFHRLSPSIRGYQP